MLASKESKKIKLKNNKKDLKCPSLSEVFHKDNRDNFPYMNKKSSNGIVLIMQFLIKFKGIHKII